MNRKTMKRIMAVFMTLTLLYGCTADDGDHTIAEKPVEPLTVSGAMDWYNASVGVLAKQKSTTDDSADIPYKPFGNLAQLFTNELWYAVESPLDFGDNNLMIMTPEVSDYADMHGNEAVKQVMKLVVLRNKETGETYSFIMAVIPELDYMLRKGDELDKSTYLSPDSDLDGYVLFYTLDGELINGRVYERGKVTGSINSPIEGKKTKKLIAYEISITCQWGQETGCYINGEYQVIGYTTHSETSYVTVYVDNGIGMDPPLPPASTGGGGGGGNTSTSNPDLPLTPTPFDDSKKEPVERTDCSGSATQNANDAQNAMKSLDVLTDLNTLRGYAKNAENEWGMRIDFVDGKPKAYALHEGGTGSVPISYFDDTAYDLHSHPKDTKGYNLTGFSMGDVYGALQIGGDANYSIYKGGIVVAYDGSEYLLAVNDRTKLQKFWGNDSNKGLFKPGENDYFGDEVMNTEYKKIREQLDSKGFSKDDTHDYAMSYLLDKYDTGLKISKKEDGESEFKELKTEFKNAIIGYQPKKCP